MTLLESGIKPVHDNAGSLIGFKYVSKDVPDDQAGQEPRRDPAKGISDCEKSSEELLR